MNTVIIKEVKKGMFDLIKKLDRIETRINELDRGRAEMKSTFYWARRHMLIDELEVVKRKLLGEDYVKDVEVEAEQFILID